MGAIGILGGMGPQASSKLYELLISRASNFTTINSDEDFPDIVLLNIPVPNFISNKENKDKAKAVILDHLKILETANTSINAIACNTAHQLLPDINSVSSLEFVSMPRLVEEHARSMKLKRIGLLGSPSTLQSNLYDFETTSSLELVKPSNEQVKILEDLIMRQIREEITPSDRKTLEDLSAKFKSDSKLDAVILGCTELPVILGDTGAFLDSLQILADGLLKRYYAK